MTDEQKQKLAEEYVKNGCTPSTWQNGRERKFAIDIYLAGLNRGLDECQKLRGALEKAAQYLREGKAKFAPHTTNSFVDDWLKDFEALQHTSQKDD